VFVTTSLTARFDSDLADGVPLFSGMEATQPVAKTTIAKGSRGFLDHHTCGRRTSCRLRFSLTIEVAERLRCSLRTVHELTRSGRIPHRKLPRSRRCLFRLDELEAWEAGAPLESLESANGGRIVRPIATDP
jgi:excisionase family DNA binding protein